jgi:hypothetical protein
MIAALPETEFVSLLYITIQQPDPEDGENTACAREMMPPHLRGIAASAQYRLDE